MVRPIGKLTFSIYQMFTKCNSKYETHSLTIKQPTDDLGLINIGLLLRAISDWARENIVVTPLCYQFDSMFIDFLEEETRVTGKL